MKQRDSFLYIDDSVIDGSIGGVYDAMDEYAIDVLEWFFGQQYHPGSVDVDARDSAEKTYKNYLEILESKNNESKA